MTKRSVRKEANALIQEGLGRQQIFDTLNAQGTGMEVEALANLVRYMPSLATRAKYRVAHATLLILLWISAVSKSLFGVGMALERGWSQLPFAILLPAITIVLAIGIAMYRTRAYHTVAFVTIIGLVRMSTRTTWSEADLGTWVGLCFSASMVGLAWYLFTKMASNYEVHDAPDGSKRIAFPPEPSAA